MSEFLISSEYVSSAANKYYSFVGHHEQRNKATNQIFSGHNKTMNKTSLTTFLM